MAERFWMLERNPKELDRFSKLSQRTVGQVRLNSDVIDAALYYNAKKFPDKYHSTIALSPDFPRLRIALPEAGVPDFFGAGAEMFASRKLRDALAQPPDVVQYVPIELAAGGPSVIAQDFKWMRVLVDHPAMDREQSKYSTLEGDDAPKKSPPKRAMMIEKFVFIPDFRAPCEIFSVQEAMLTWVASDALAERVLRAKCTGIEFCEPETVGIWRGIRRFRTLKGIGERTVGM